MGRVFLYNQRKIFLDDESGWIRLNDAFVEFPNRCANIFQIGRIVIFRCSGTSDVRSDGERRISFAHDGTDWLRHVRRAHNQRALAAGIGVRPRRWNIY